MPAPIHHAIDITASPVAVWRALTDLSSWPRWFPYAASARALEGTAFAEGSAFEVALAVPIAGTVAVRLAVRSVEPERRLVLAGRGFGVRAEHLYTVEDRGAWTRLSSHDTFAGLVVTLGAARLRDRLDDLAHDALERLKAVVEGVPG